MINGKIWRLFRLIEPYRIYDNGGSKFWGEIQIKDGAPSEVKEARQKLLQWQKRVEAAKKKGYKF